MRKITLDSIDAFVNRYDFKRQNMEVAVSSKIVRMFLHDNLIAEYNYESKELTVSSAGWETVTTKERLNGLLSHYGLPTIYQKNWIWYWTDGKTFENSRTFKI